MQTTSLREFVSHARQAGRIRFGDLRRLQRDILPARLTTAWGVGARNRAFAETSSPPGAWLGAGSDRSREGTPWPSPNPTRRGRSSTASAC